MKLVIDIPDKAFENLQRFKDKFLSRPEIAVKHGTPLPDNATNGDVIKAIFDVTEVRQLDCCAFIDTSDDANMRTYKEWWNAKYKKGENK